MAAIPLAGLIVLPWLALGLASLFMGFPRLQIRQVLGIVLVVAWSLALFAGTGQEEIQLLATVVLLLIAFGGMWLNEFRLLMSRRDDEFPGKYDKLVWSLALVIFAPAGVWLFRFYRQSRRPANAAADAQEPAPSP